MFLLAFLGATLLATRRAKYFGLSPVRAVDLGLTVFISGVLGARVFHIFIEAPRYYWDHPLRVFYFWQGGFVLYGGILVGILAGYFFVRYFKEKAGLWADLCAPSVLLGIAIGRIGCLGAGCCYGAKTDWLWGLQFTDPRSGAPLHVSLHPTQILEILLTALAALLFHFLIRKPSRPSGAGLVWMLIAYSALRFAIEFFRGDADRGLYFGSLISTSQIISILVILGCMLWFFWMRGLKPALHPLP